ncbi:hypothetical protein FFV08_11505 [Streptococcus sanguinis]|uniref:LXG domain-containing protein n=1 Tax=Streptococcus sanguinis TaxID=1305 RepID=A0A7H8V974_STRSA|nr:hypothetical protein FFV08_11505 [Streptococcus sanguinis]
MVKVNYASLQTQSSTMSSASQSRVAGFNQLISAFDSFGGSGGELIGTGYDAARAYATSVMSPYYKGCILYSEAVADAANTLADSYVAKCGAENLDEEQLQAEIDSATRGCMGLSASISGLQSKSKPAAGDAERIGRLQEQLTAAENQLTAAQKKLDNLRAFSAESPSACASADGYQGLVSKAMSGISVSFGGGGFALPEDLSWVSDVEQGWADREIALENNYLSALDKVYSGESLTEAELTAIERYAAAYPERVDASVLEYVQQARQVKAEEMKYRSIIDKVDAGKELSDSDTKFIEEYKKNHPDVGINPDLEKASAEKSEYNKIVEKAHKGKLSDEDVQILIKYGEKFPDVRMPEDVKKALKTYLEGINQQYEAHGQTLDNINTVIDMLGEGAVRFGAFIRRIKPLVSGPAGPNSFVIVNPQSIQNASNVVSAGSNISKYANRFGYALTGIGFGLGMYDDMVNKDMTLTEAVGHNSIATGLSLAIGAIGTGLAAATPVGWMALGVIAATAAVNWYIGDKYQEAYKNNKEVRDFSTGVGEGLLQSISNPMLPNLLW